MKHRCFIITQLWLIFLLVGLTACSGVNLSMRQVVPETAKLESVVLSDTHNRPVPVGRELKIVSAHTDPDGIKEVRFYVNGTLINSQSPPFSQTFFKVEHCWTPPEAKTYAVEIVVYSYDQNKEPSKIDLTVEATSSILPVVFQTPTAPQPAPPSGGKVACLNASALVEDVTVPDGSEIQPEARFNKTWRIINTGTCKWGPGYYFDHVDGPDLGATLNTIPETPAGGQVDITLPMVAPKEPGTYRSSWRLFDPQNEPFGGEFFVEFVVPEICKMPNIKLFKADPSTIERGGSSTLSWEVEGADRIEISSVEGVWTANTGSVVVSPDETTTYTLTAKDGTCTATGKVTVQVTASTGLPAPPSNLRITKITQSGFTLSWQDNSNNESGFKLYNAENDQFLAAFPANITQREQDGLACNTTYRLKLRAYNIQGESGDSNVVEGKTTACN
jgi:hypothetical protein